MELAPRLAYLLRVEGMINVGCKFGPNDLAPQVWDQLLVLAAERHLVDKLLDSRRDHHRQQSTAENKARATTGVPPPGGTLFPHSKPFKGSTR